MIHACGQVDVARHIVFAANFVAAARGALAAGAPILCDSEMVAHGVTRARCRRSNEVICTLNDPRVAGARRKSSTPRVRRRRSICGSIAWPARWSPSAMRRPRCFGCSISSTAGAPKPAAIIGIPVGFVGAAESKEALAADPRGVPFLIVRGRMGGSAMTAAAVNALARAGL